MNLHINKITFSNKAKEETNKEGRAALSNLERKLSLKQLVDAKAYTMGKVQWKTAFNEKAKTSYNVGVKGVTLVWRFKGKFILVTGNTKYVDRKSNFMIDELSIYKKDVSNNGVAIKLVDEKINSGEYKNNLEELVNAPGFVLKVNDTSNIETAIDLFKEMDDFKQTNESVFIPITDFAKRIPIHEVNLRSVANARFTKIRGRKSTYVASTDTSGLPSNSYQSPIMLFKSKPLKNIGNIYRTLNGILRDSGRLIYATSENKSNHSNYINLVDFSVQKVSQTESVISLMIDESKMNMSKNHIVCIYDRLSYIKTNTMLDVVSDIKNRRIANNNLFEFLFNDGPYEAVARLANWNVDRKLVSEHLRKMNKEQGTAFKLAVDNHPITFIQGPPGTGKTYTITEIAKYYSARGKKVLVSSQTNVAVENILENLMEQDDFADLCAKADASGSDFTPENIVALYEEKLARMLDLPKYDLSEVVMEDLLVGSRVVGSTTTSSSLNKRQWNGFSNKIDVLIIDEISKSSVPELIRYIVNAKKIILVGDQRQLAPLDELTDDDIKAKYTNKEMGIIKDYIMVSIFDKLFKVMEDHKRAIMLKENMRSVKSILDAYSTFYDDALIATRKDEDTKLQWNTTPLAPLTFMSMKGSTEEFVGTSRRNIAEAKYIDNLLYDLARDIDNSKELTVAIIATYGEQVKTIKESVATIIHEKNNFKQVRVNTVDAFQGNQADIVIVSTVLADTQQKSFGFISDYRRLNVAISRAKDLMIILGNNLILEQVEMNYDGTKRLFFKEIFAKMDKVDTSKTQDNILEKKVA